MDKLLSAFAANEISRAEQKQINGGYMYVYAFTKTNGNGMTFDWYNVFSDDGGTYYGQKPSSMGTDDRI